MTYLVKRCAIGMVVSGVTVSEEIPFANDEVRR